MIIKSFHLFESNSDEIMNEIRSILLKMGLKFTLRYRNRGSRKPEQDELELIVLLKENNLSFPKNWLECLNLDFIQKIESLTPYQFYYFFQFESAPNSLYIQLKNRERKSSKYEDPDMWGKKEDNGEYVFLDEYFDMLIPSPPKAIQLMEDIALEWIDDGYSFGVIFEIKPYLTNKNGQYYYHGSDSRHSDWTSESKSRPEIYLNHGGYDQYILRFSCDKVRGGVYSLFDTVTEFVSPFLKRLNAEYDVSIQSSARGVKFDSDFNALVNKKATVWQTDSLYITVRLS